MIGTEVHGLSNMTKLLKKLPLSVRNKALAQMTKKGAEVILEEAQNNVPVDTGQTKESLVIRKQRSKDENVIHYGVIPLLSKTKIKRFKTAKGEKWSIKGEVASGYAAFYIHFGTSTITPNPFLSEAGSKSNEAFNVGKQYLAKKMPSIIKDAKS